MGLAQLIKFKSNTEELEKLLLSLEFEKIDENYFKLNNPERIIEIKIVEDGIYIHRAGIYFEDLGKLIEGLGNITEAITIEDYP